MNSAHDAVRRSNCLTSMAKLDDSKEGGPAQGKNAPESAVGDHTRPLTWSEAETMDILNDDETMRDIEASREDMKAGRVVVWKPRDAENTRST